MVEVYQMNGLTVLVDWLCCSVVYTWMSGDRRSP